MSPEPSHEQQLLDAIRRIYGAAPARLSIAWLEAAQAGVELFLREPSPDFRSVRWDGDTYLFTEPQAAVVQVLWDARRRGVPEIGNRRLLAEARSSADRVVDVFKIAARKRTGGKPGEKAPQQYHPAYGRLIVPGVSKGTHRLAE